MANKSPLVDKSIEELQMYTDLFSMNNRDNIKITCYLLYVGSLVDTKGYQHRSEKEVSDLRKQLVESGIKNEEIQMMVDFAEEYTTNMFSSTQQVTEKWRSSHKDNMEGLFPKLKECFSSSKFAELQKIAKRVMKVPSPMLNPVEPEQDNTEEWHGGSLKKFISLFGDTMVRTLIYDCLVEDPGQEKTERKDRHTHPTSRKAFRLSRAGRCILRGVLRETKSYQDCNKACEERLDVDNIYVSPAPKFKVTFSLGKPEEGNKTVYKEHDADSWKSNCLRLQKVIKAILQVKELPKEKKVKVEKDGEVEKDGKVEKGEVDEKDGKVDEGEVICPPDVLHLYHLLGNAANGYETWHHQAIFNHPCSWKPSEVVRNIFVMDMILPKEAGSKVQNARAEINMHVGTKWRDDIMYQQSPYSEVYWRWVFDTQEKRPVHFEPNRGFDVLRFMRNCFPHAGQYLGVGQNFKNLKSAIDVEQDLFVMFPLFMSHLYLVTLRNKFSFGDLLYSKR